MPESAPFRQVPYESLPELPRLPHPFFDAALETVCVDTGHFGKVKIAVRRWGSGPPLLCIHGLMTSSYSFRYLLEPLGKHFELIMPDLPGAGDSEAPDVAYGPREMALLVGALMAQMGLQRPRVLANSMGGYLAMWLALERPEAMACLVNLHSPGHPIPRLWALQTLGRIPGTRALLDQLVRREPERWAFRNIHYFDETLKSREEARVYGAPLRTGAGRMAFSRYLFDTLRASDMRAFAQRVRSAGRFPIPLQLVYARQDPMVPPSVGHALSALIPGAEMVWLERGSHFAHVDAPTEFLDAALPFLLGK